MLTAPQCIECAERRMRVQSMEARCFIGIILILRQQKMVIVSTKKGYKAKPIMVIDKRMVIVATQIL